MVHQAGFCTALRKCGLQGLIFISIRALSQANAPTSAPLAEFHHLFFSKRDKLKRATVTTYSLALNRPRPPVEESI